MIALYLAQIVNSGLALGSVYGLLALGFSLVYNSSRLINFAQGELLLISSLGLYSLSAHFELGALTGLIAAGVMGLILGYLLYAGTLGLSLKARPLNQLMLTVAAALAWQGAAILIWGKKPLLLPRFLPLPAVQIPPFFLSQDTMTALTLAIVSVAALILFLMGTKTGRAIRAVSSKPLAARLQGIDPAKCYALSFGLAGIAAALAGMAVGPQTMLRHDMGIGLGLKGFVAATMGGYAQPLKVFMGGIFLGIFEASLVLFIGSELKEAASFSLLIVLLAAIPPKENLKCAA